MFHISSNRPKLNKSILWEKTPKYKNALSLMRRAKKKGYKKAFIVAFKSGKKIKLKDALK